MISAFLESFVFCCPSDPTDDQIISFITSLLEWRDIGVNGWITTRVSLQTADCLAKAGCGFPPWKAVSDLINQRGLDLSTKDVFSIIDGLLNRLPKIEEALGLADILVSEAECAPPLHLERGEVFLGDFERLLGLICLFKERSDPGNQSSHIVLSRQIYSCPITVTFRGQLEDVDPLGQEVLPRKLAIAVPVFECASHFMEHVDPVDIWRSAVSDEGFMAAVRLYAQRAARISGIQYSTAWRLGSSFTSTVRERNLVNAHAGSKILRACSETILQQRMADTHPLRVNLGANSPQVTRGRDTAWRRDIDYELHLYYWQTPAGTELASVALHEDYSIPR